MVYAYRYSPHNVRTCLSIFKFLPYLRPNVYNQLYYYKKKEEIYKKHVIGARRFDTYKTGKTCITRVGRISCTNWLYFILSFATEHEAFIYYKLFITLGQVNLFQFVVLSEQKQKHVEKIDERANIDHKSCNKSKKDSKQTQFKGNNRKKVKHSTANTHTNTHAHAYK